MPTILGRALRKRIRKAGKKMKNLSVNIKFLEKAFDLLNKEYFENTLSKPVITVQSSPKTYGHFTTGKIWKDNAESFHEINISAESLNRPVQETIGTLLHEMVHLYCSENGIKDTSRGGTYHNKIFKVEAERRGLIIGYDTKIGHSKTTPTEKLLQFINEKKLNQTITYHREKTEKQAKKKKTSSTRKYVCPDCEQSIRATKEVHIKCADCDTLMKCEN